jgi:hypothetical protein
VTVAKPLKERLMFEMLLLTHIHQYIEEQEGQPVTEDSRFQIDPS